MKIRHIASENLWLLTKGNNLLYRGSKSPWQSPRVIAAALRREGKGNFERGLKSLVA